MMRFALIAGALALTLAASGPARANPSILTYHGALDRAGLYVMPALTYQRARDLHLDASFHAAYRGGVYAQPLLWQRPGSGGAMLIVATDRDEVYAIDARSGAQIWERALGEPVPLSALPCGNLPLLGIIGAPVIDPRRATLYLDAMVMRAGEPRHEIYALKLADGSVEPGWPVDVATALKGSFKPAAQNERGALALFGGRVFVPFSGHFGDCGDYHGVLVGVSESDPAKVESFSTRARGGGIWAQAGSPATASRCSSRPAIRSARAPGATAKRSCASPQISPARPARATISPPRTGGCSIAPTRTSAQPRPSPSTFLPPRACASSSWPSTRPAKPTCSTATISAESAARSCART